MSEALIPSEQKQVLFYDDEVTVVRLSNGAVYIPIRPICDYLGIDWSSQRQRITRDPVLAEVKMSVVVTTTDIDEGSRRPRTSEMVCLPLDYISGFLFGINTSRVKEEVRERLIRYQRECYQVLAEAFREGRLMTDAPFADLLETADEGLVQAYQMAQAVVQLARHQILLDARVAQTEKRLDTIEAQLGNSEQLVTPDQASQISQAVKAVAIAIGKQSKRNEFGAVYGEMYRHFGITSYKQLPAKRFQECMDWLNNWHQEVTSDVPF